jgi:hypothetical protein
LLTSYQLQQAPETQDDKQSCQLALFAPENDLEHERRYDDDSIEDVERRMCNSTVRIVEFEAE